LRHPLNHGIDQLLKKIWGWIGMDSLYSGLMQADPLDIFESMRAGGVVPKEHPQWPRVWKLENRAIRLSAGLNTATDLEQILERLGDLNGKPIDGSTRIFVPFYTKFGKHIILGRNVFINHACTFLDLGGITIEDEVQIGPRVSLITENHPLAPRDRKSLDLGAVCI